MNAFFMSTSSIHTIKPRQYATDTAPSLSRDAKFTAQLSIDSDSRMKSGLVSSVEMVVVANNKILIILRKLVLE